jgi:hypothetical protein
VAVFFSWCFFVLLRRRCRSLYIKSEEKQRKNNKPLPLSRLSQPRPGDPAARLRPRLLRFSARDRVAWDMNLQTEQRKQTREATD